eukprot:g3666.t1
MQVAFYPDSFAALRSGCAPSLTFQFADPVAAGFFRHFYPRLRRLGDFNECWERVAALATFDRRHEGLRARLKALASTSIALHWLVLKVLLWRPRAYCSS